MLVRKVVAGLAAVLLAGACGSSVTSAETGGTTGSGAGGGASASAATSSSTSTTGSTGGGGSGGGAASPNLSVSTATQLYAGSLPAAPSDPLDLTLVGPFDCIGSGGNQDSSMTAVAFDGSGNLWGVSAHNAYRLTLGTAFVHCVTTIPLASPGGTFAAMAFAPAGAIDPTAETLVLADTAGNLFVLDMATGSLQQRGYLGMVPAADPQGNAYPSDPAVTGTTTTVGTRWRPSGGLGFGVSSSGAVGFAVVHDCSGAACSDVDTLVEIDVPDLAQFGGASVLLGVRGQIRKSAGCTDPNNAIYGHLAGMAATGSTVYGFSHDGYVIAASNVDGSACLVNSMPAAVWAGATVPPTVSLSMP